jgi:hypothetical protein
MKAKRGDSGCFIIMRCSNDVVYHKGKEEEIPDAGGKYDLMATSHRTVLPVPSRDRSGGTGSGSLSNRSDHGEQLLGLDGRDGL